MSLKMSVGGEEGTTKPVTAVDQQNINKFARLYQKSQEACSELKRKNDELQNLGEAADELLLLDDGEPVPLKLGDTFVCYSGDDVNDKIERLKAKLEDDIAGLKSQNEQYQGAMAILKAELYGKFGKNINLESEDD